MLRRPYSLLLAILGLWLAVGPAPAQVMRRPSGEAFQFSDPGELAWPPNPDIESLQPPLAPAEPPHPDRPPDARDGMFQKLIFTPTWLASGSADGLGMSDIELKTVLAFPIPSRKWPLIVTPGFGVHYLDGPEVSDVPPRLYDAYTQFRWMRRWSPRWATDLAVTPGVYSDFERHADEALRITGHGAAMFTWRPTAKLVLGVAYLDREDLNVLPIGGLIWTPTPNLEFELVAPRPKIARRVYWTGATAEAIQDWIYLAGEYGGGTWAIRRDDERDDELTYSDFRVILGTERRHIGGLDGRLEIGYVFGRRLEYRSQASDLHLDDTVMLRGSLIY